MYSTKQYQNFMIACFYNAHTFCLLISGQTGSNNTVCNLPYTEYFRGSCYHFVNWASHNNPGFTFLQTWQLSKLYCESINGTLLTIHDEDEAYFIKVNLFTCVTLSFFFLLLTFFVTFVNFYCYFCFICYPFSVLMVILCSFQCFCCFSYFFVNLFRIAYFWLPICNLMSYYNSHRLHVQLLFGIIMWAHKLQKTNIKKLQYYGVENIAPTVFYVDRQYTFAHDWFEDRSSPYQEGAKLVYIGLLSKSGTYTWLDGAQIRSAVLYTLLSTHLSNVTPCTNSMQICFALIYESESGVPVEA